MPLPSKRPQARQRILVPGQRDVEIKSPRVLDELLRTDPHIHRRVGQHRGGADGEIRKRAPRVREDDPAPSIPPQDPAHHHVDGRARGLVRVVDHRLREVGVREPRVRGVGGVHEDDGGLGVQVLPDRFEIGVAQIVVGGTVAREERDAVRAQLVEGAVHLREGGARGVQDGGQSGEEAVAARVGVTDAGGGVVDLAGETDGVGARGDCHAWSCEG